MHFWCYQGVVQQQSKSLVCVHSVLYFQRFSLSWYKPSFLIGSEDGTNLWRALLSSPLCLLAVPVTSQRAA